MDVNGEANDYRITCTFSLFEKKRVKINVSKDLLVESFHPTYK